MKIKSWVVETSEPYKLSVEGAVLTCPAVSFVLCRDRPTAADCMTHPWLWQHYPGTEPLPSTPRTLRERSGGGKWAAPPEDPEDKENILDSPHAKRFRFEEDMPTFGEPDHWGPRKGGTADARVPSMYFKK